MIYLLFKQVLIMFLLVGVGYICFRKNKITLEGSRNIANILIYLSLPCVIINSFLVTFSYEKLIGLLYSSLAAIAVLVISMVISKLFFGKDAILNFAAAFSNPGFFGIPLIVGTISNEAVFYIATFIAFLNYLQWSYGVALLINAESIHNEKGEWKKYIPSFKRLISAPFLIAVIIGLFFFISQIHVPDLLLKSVQHIAGLNTPLAMFSIGVYLAQINPIRMLKNHKLYLLALVRLIIIPAACMLVLMLLPAEFTEMKMALLIAVACPTGSNVAVYAQLYESDYGYAVETVIISTLLSVITIPVLVQLAMSLCF